ncbi:aldehyde dehydrogenase family protein [Streptomyces aurantiogriseus]|uniref:Aldehyde dehydrogenase n=1 Tax=Streptomyces aurantiogriseus TaxID=66870 RepID=A0A918FKS4_9ACTN|nr:aldehyde dehydrogenase family protein [Streptomyces aurantiogriseus]GGR47392.1 aldehyde dehydrogenase [Streptomyces aurantiogriseus]
MRQSLMTIDGEAVGGDDSFEIINPATGAPVGRAPQCSPAQLDAAMNAAQRAFTTWRQDAAARREALHRAATVVRKSAQELGPLFTEEQGRPLFASIGEITYSADWLDYYADLEMPDESVVTYPDRTLEISRRPVGVVGAMTPWNAPILLAMWKIAPALAAGNTVVLKPSPFTPLTTLALGRILADTLPPGVLNVLSGLEPLGRDLVAHPTPRKISFTGSVPTGKLVAAAAAQDLKLITLELGGNDAAILLDDVDIDAVLEPLFFSAFANTGQICEATKRVYVPRRLYGKVLDALADRARAARVGNGLEPGVELGPLTTPFQRDHIEELVEDARAAGATIAVGGRRLPGDGYFFEPTVVGDIEDGTRLVDEEQFGPALPVIPYTDLDEAISRANRSPYGLGGSVWTKDLDRARAVARRLDTGRVRINTAGQIPPPEAPFGGVKWSGIGVENGPWGLAAFTELHVTEIANP